MHGWAATLHIGMNIQGVASLDIAQLEMTLDHVPDIVFFVKDDDARYVALNHTLVLRTGVEHKDALRGKTARAVFPTPLGESYEAQDQRVLRTGVPIEGQLELHLYPTGVQGWCVTWKRRLTGGGGIVGISRDLHRPDHAHPGYPRLAEALDIIEREYATVLPLSGVAKRVGLAMHTFEALTKEIYQVTPRQLLAKRRIDVAARLLASSSEPISTIAQACGYSNHSAFSRQFKATLGIAPTTYRVRAVELKAT